MPRYVDTVADAGVRITKDYLFNGANALNIDSLILLIESTANSMGWTTVASTTTSGHPDRTIQSVQSPWHDEIAIATGLVPSTYHVQIRVRFYATSNTLLRVRAANWDGSIAQTAGDTTLTSFSNCNLRLNFNPYQLCFWVPGDSIRFLASAPHIPWWIQTAGVREIVYVSGNNNSAGLARGLYDNGAHVFYYQDFNGINKKTDLVTPSGGLGRFMVSSTRAANPSIANPIDDTTLTDGSKWFPLMNPAAVAIPGTLTNFTDTQGTPYLFWFWDMITTSRNPNSVVQQQIFDNGNIYEAITYNNSNSSTAAGCVFIRTS